MVYSLHCLTHVNFLISNRNVFVRLSSYATGNQSMHVLYSVENSLKMALVHMEQWHQKSSGPYKVEVVIKDQL